MRGVISISWGCICSSGVQSSGGRAPDMGQFLPVNQLVGTTINHRRAVKTQRLSVGGFAGKVPVSRTVPGGDSGERETTMLCFSADPPGGVRACIRPVTI